MPFTDDDLYDDLMSRTDDHRERYGDPCPHCHALRWMGDCPNCTPHDEDDADAEFFRLSGLWTPVD
jgi:hypothetical protein